MKINSTLLICIFSLFFFAANAQEIELYPSKGWQGNLMEVSIFGTNTQFASASSTCGALEPNKIIYNQGTTNFSPVSINVVNDEVLHSQINITSNAPTGLYDVILWAGQGGCEVSCQDCYEIFPKSQIISVSPDQENLNSTNIDVVITTDYSCFTQGSTTCQVNPGNVRFFQAAPNTFDFQPNSVTILNDRILVANIDLPSFVIVDNYNIVVAEGYPCEATCEDCFEVLADPFMELITGNQGRRGEDTLIVLEVFFADLTACSYDATTVYLELGNYVLFPDNITVNGQIINVEVSIPGDAPLGDYDIVVGEGLGEDCEYRCAGCFTVDTGVNTIAPLYDKELSIFPNPSNGQFRISSERTLYEAKLEIYDASGRLVVFEELEMFKSKSFSLTTKGLYLVKVSTKDAIRIQRLVVD